MLYRHAVFLNIGLFYVPAQPSKAQAPSLTPNQKYILFNYFNDKLEMIIEVAF